MNVRINAKPGSRKGMRSAEPASRALPSPRNSFVLRLGEALVDRCEIEAGDTILVAVSGGADSLALLAGLTALAGRSHRRYSIHVACVHHHLREDAEAEVQYVKEVTDSLGVPFHRLDVHPGNHPGNTSANARTARYEAMVHLATSLGAAAIATAHHGTDQLETLLLALVRGAGLDGLAAMPWRNGVYGVSVIRPLLNQTHEDCLDLCRGLGWRWCEDPTNQDASLARSRMRQEVLRSLLNMRPGLDADIHRTTDLLRAASDLIGERVDAHCEKEGTTSFCRDDFARENPLVLGAVLRRTAIDLGARADRLSHEVTMSVVEAIRDGERHPRRFCWPGGIEILITTREVRLERKTP